MTIEYVLVSIDWNNSGLIVKKSSNPSRNRDLLSIYKSDNRGCEYEVSFDGLTNLIYIDTNTCTETYPSQMDKLNWTMIIIIIILRQQRTKAVSNKNIKNLLSIINTIFSTQFMARADFTLLFTWHHGHVNTRGDAHLCQYLPVF